MIGSFSVAPRVKVGESHPGTPILWPDSEFNQSAKVISSKFYGADELTVVVETEMEGGIHRPEVMREIEAFQRYMEQDPKVGGTLSIVDYMKAINRTFHNSDPRWSIGALHAAGDRRPLVPVRGGLARSARAEPGARSGGAQCRGPRVLRRPQGRHDPRARSTV